MVRLARTEAIGGVVLTVAVVAALIWTNLPDHSSYGRFWDTPLHWSFVPADLFGTWREWVNNGLMTVFFLAVGLEVGRERANGSLRDNRNALLPVVAALGGMAGAALVYLAMAGALGAGSAAMRGWGIPMATDVAFTLGAMALLGRRVPAALRVFVLALAVADDVGSVVVLAFISSSHLHPWALAGALACLTGVVVLRRRVTAWWPYVVAAVAVWLLLAWASIDPTLAGAFVGMLVPCALPHRRGRSGATTDVRLAPAEREVASVQSGAVGGPTKAGPLSPDRGGPSGLLEKVTNPLSILFVLPVFVLANAGATISRHMFADPSTRSVVIAIVVARLLGKTGGITLAALLLARLGMARLPEGVGWSKLAGAAAMCGIGFTVPLLFAGVAFAGRPTLLSAARVGLLAGTALAFALGSGMLVMAARRTGRRHASSVQSLESPTGQATPVPPIPQ